MTDRPNVLVIEDNAGLSSMISNALGNEFDVFETVAIEEAKSYLNAACPSVVILDGQRSADSLESQLLAWIRRNPRTKRTRVIVVTSLEQIPEQSDRKEVVADAYLATPLSPSLLVEAVRTQLNATLTHSSGLRQ